MSNASDNNLKNNNEYTVATFLWEMVKLFFLALVIIVPIRLFLFQPFFVEGSSMRPNFTDGDYLIVNEIGYKTTALNISGRNIFTVKSFRNLKRDDVVVFRYPRDPSKFFIKRIIGLPGETVKIKNGFVYICNNAHPEGIKLDEKSYLSNKVKTVDRGKDTFILKNNEYFVLGDNRNGSSDSRVWGPVKKKYIVGKVIIRAWPINNFKVFTGF